MAEYESFRSAFAKEPSQNENAIDKQSPGQSEQQKTEQKAKE
jgi:hypothetical protein